MSLILPNMQIRARSRSGKQRKVVQDQVENRAMEESVMNNTHISFAEVSWFIHNRRTHYMVSTSFIAVVIENLIRRGFF